MALEIRQLTDGDGASRPLLTTDLFPVDPTVVNGSTYFYRISDILALVTLPTQVQAGITAHAGGGQASAYPLTALYSQVTTVATSLDSVVFPAAVPGGHYTVVNTAVNTLNVYPLGTNAFSGLAGGAPVPLTYSNLMEVICFVAGTWVILR